MKESVLWALLVFPLLSLFFLERSELRRFLPVAWFVTVINSLVYQAAHHFTWWEEQGLFGWDNIVPVPWVYSAYLVATIWIFKFTYGRFLIYLVVNVILDGIYSFAWYPIQQKIGLAGTGGLPAYIPYLMMLAVAVLIYLYQMWQEDDLAKIISGSP
ncbi:hypothetical protein [Paenibacillus sambharensis]|uniref:hypothetical protein n=1 Tax=Paenibacillus sambharensis TaxID=1803190 RepID=UPI001FEC5E45|nr:hypothetical protein [Paenibacillus sambharensis]